MNSVETDLMLGLLGILLFLFRNPDKNYRNIISACIAALFISQLMYLYISPLSGQVVWAVSGMCLLGFYLARVKGKLHGGVLALVKITGLILLIIYPLPFYSLIDTGSELFWIVVRPLTFFILGTIYVYDRWILKPEKMKAKFITVLVIQTLLIFVMLTFSLIQKSLADERQEDAFRQRELAIQLEMKLLEQRKSCKFKKD